jgi:UDP-N-acetylmuramoyl-tripeptide--D-alanyl-D-alanine ligase
MYQNLKKRLYFFVAGYFRFLASIRLRIWKPRIIVITGSSGKTTLLHLIESQLNEKAKYTHDANSSFGIPFDILGLHRKTLLLYEWPVLFLLAPIRVFCRLPKQRLYIVEADCDRPHEGKFLSEFLKPEVTLWTNVSRTHSVNFEKEVYNGEFKTVDEAIAYEFGYYAQNTEKLVIVGDSSENLDNQLSRVKCIFENISGHGGKIDYSVSVIGSVFVINGEKYVFRYLLPKKTSTLILMCSSLMKYLNEEFDGSFVSFQLVPGRSSVFEGIKNTTLVDSSYNANLDSMTEVINMFSKIEAKEKWVVLGDMIEQGSQEEEEHKKLAMFILKCNFEKIILMGPRISKYTKPILFGKNTNVVSFTHPKEVLNYLESNIKGGEVILFKGARFLEGVIEHLLKNAKDIKKLARRESVWQIRREKWGL